MQCLGEAHALTQVARRPRRCWLRSRPGRAAAGLSLASGGVLGLQQRTPLRVASRAPLPLRLHDHRLCSSVSGKRMPPCPRVPRAAPSPSRSTAVPFWPSLLSSTAAGRCLLLLPLPTPSPYVSPPLPACTYLLYLLHTAPVMMCLPLCVSACLLCCDGTGLLSSPLLLILRPLCLPRLLLFMFTLPPPMGSRAGAAFCVGRPSSTM